MARQLKTKLAVCAFAIASAGPATAGVVWNDVTADFSNNRAAPTFVPFGLGQNDVIGQTGSADGTGATTDRDYFTFIVPNFSRLVSLTLLNLGLTAGGASFIGLQAGATVTVNPAAPDPSLLLGYEHLDPSDVGLDILPEMGAKADAAGFTPPLGAGQYSVWLQDSNIAPSSYTLRFGIAAVPEPATVMLGLVGFLMVWRARWTNRSSHSPS
jgi:hypothetical protein